MNSLYAQIVWCISVCFVWLSYWCKPSASYFLTNNNNDHFLSHNIDVNCFEWLSLFGSWSFLKFPLQVIVLFLFLPLFWSRVGVIGISWEQNWPNPECSRSQAIRLLHNNALSLFAFCSILRLSWIDRGWRLGHSDFDSPHHNLTVFSGIIDNWGKIPAYAGRKPANPKSTRRNTQKNK